MSVKSQELEAAAHDFHEALTEYVRVLAAEGSELDRIENELSFMVYRAVEKQWDARNA